MELFMREYIPYLVLLLQIIVTFFILLAFFRKTTKEFHSNWNTLLDNFNFSTKEFYELLTKELTSKGINGIRTKNVSLAEGGLFSFRRQYLRVEWRDYQYDICAAPFGKGFFVSWWLLYKNPIGKILINKIPFVGQWIVNRLYKITYYKIDTASMFMSYAQASVLKVIDDITNEKGIRSLTESERKPIMRDIFKR